MNALIHADLFRAVYVAVSKDERRYYLGGVYLEPHPVKGVLLTATDGSRLLNAWDEKGVIDAPMIVKLSPDLLKACKRPARQGTPRLVRVVDGIASIVDADTSDNESATHVAGPAVAQGFNDCRIDGTFPDWRRVVPRIDNETPCSPAGFAFNPKLVGDLASVTEALSATLGAQTVAVSLYSVDNGSPVVVHFDACTIAFGVIMPMHGLIDAPHALPAYMSAQREPDAIAA